MFEITPKILAEKLTQIQENFNQLDMLITNELSNIKWDLNQLKTSCQHMQNTRNWGLRNAKINKKIIAYKNQGLSTIDAICLTADELSESADYCMFIYKNNSEKIKKNMKKQGKKIMIAELIKQGYKNKEIAKITGFTPEYISMLKTGKKPF